MMGRSFFVAGICCIGLAFAPASSAWADVQIVNWGGDYISPPPNSQDLQGKNANTVGNVTGRNFSTSVAMNPVSGYSGTSGTFYGGASTQLQNAGVSPGYDVFEVQNQGSNDMLNFHIQQGVDNHDLHLAMFWDKANFLNGGNAPQPVTFLANAQFALSITNANSSMANAAGRWLVRNGSNFFLSQASFVPSNGNYTYGPFASASDHGLWAAYNPSGLNIDFNQGAATFSTQSFNDITGVGFYLEHDLFGDNFGFAIPSFSVFAAPVPEPGSITLVGIACLVGMKVLSRRRKTIAATDNAELKN